MNHLTDLSCSAFAEALAAKTSVPGGGGAAAMAGALGAALCSMAGNFTAGKKKYAEWEPDIQRILAEGVALRLRLLELVELDAEGFEPLSRAYAIAKDDPLREQVMEEAILTACRAPLETLTCCAKVLALLEEMLEKGSKLLITDVGCGALLCKAAMETAALNVFVNTASLANRETAANLERQVDDALADCLPRAEKIAAAVTGYIRKEK